MKQTEIAKKYNVSDAYISQLITFENIKKKVRGFDLFKQLSQRGALKYFRNKMSEEEIKFIEEL